MKQIFAFTVALFFFLSMLSSVASADVGIGVSPSRIVMQVEGGQTQEVQLLFFNTGDDSIQVSVGIDGSIAPFTQVFPAIETVEPEPKPHSLPIKNGKVFTVKFTPPASAEAKQYVGTIAATGAPDANSQFGGSVGVATQVELNVTPTRSILSFLTIEHLLIFLAILLVLVIAYLIRKSGFKLKIERK